MYTKILGGRFGYFLFFSPREGEGGSEAPGRGGIGPFYLKIPGGGGVPGGGGGGLKCFSGPKRPPRIACVQGKRKSEPKRLPVQY